MSIVARKFRLGSYLLCLLNASSIWCLISTTVQCANMILDCRNDLNLTSPGYPSNYPSGASEEWNITAPSGRRILVTFNDFSLEDVVASVIIFDRVNTDNKKLYQGENQQFPPFLAQGHSLYVAFISSNAGEGRRGFDISVSCTDPSTVSSRLVEGTLPSEGFLELSSPSGEWSRVCEVLLPVRAAEVICGELGYPGVEEISFDNDTCISDDRKNNCTRAPSCQEYTYRLADCKPDYSACSSNTVVKMKCNDPGYKGCYKSGTLQLQNGVPFTSTSQCISSCKTDKIQAIAVMNYEECFCTTVDEAQLIDATKCSEKTELLSNMRVYNASVGFCDVLKDTEGGYWDSNITWFGSIVHLTCMDPYSLNGSGKLQCVSGPTPYNTVWNDSIPHCVMNVPTEKDKVPVIIGLSITVLVILIVCVAVYIYSKHGGSCQSCYSSRCNTRNCGKGDSGKHQSRQTRLNQSASTTEEEQSFQNLQDSQIEHPVPAQTTPLHQYL